jgi:nucleotide-binding universal stress UspA family protein
VFDSVLLAHDGSHRTEALLAPLRSLLAPGRARVLLLEVLEEKTVRSRETAESELSALAAELDRPGLAVRTRVAVGDPVRRIRETAEEEGSALIAMATCGRSGPERWLLGSVAEEVVRHADRPVMLLNVPESGDVASAPASIETIAVPLDGSERAAGILPLATTLAREHGAEIAVIHVVPERPSAAVPPPSEPTPAEAVVGDELEEIRQWGVAARLETVRGRAAPGVLEVVRKLKPDLVTMSTHGRSGLSRAFLGSVAEQVVRDVPCPVLLERH